MAIITIGDVKTAKICKWICSGSEETPAFPVITIRVTSTSGEETEITSYPIGDYDAADYSGEIETLHSAEGQ